LRKNKGEKKERKMAEKQIEVDGKEPISEMDSHLNLRYVKGVWTRFRNKLKEEIE
jgi:hypothetical protein